MPSTLQSGSCAKSGIESQTIIRVLDDVEGRPCVRCDKEGPRRNCGRFTIRPCGELSEGGLTAVVIEDMRGHRAVGQPSKVEMGSWKARMNLRIRTKGRAMLVVKLARHVIGPSAIHRMSISKLIGPVVQVYESTQRTRCRCADLLATPIGSGRIRDAKKRLAVFSGQTWTST